MSLAQARDTGAEDLKKTLQRGRTFGDLLRSTYASPTRMKVEYFEKEDHAAVPLIGSYDGLRFVFDGFTTAMDQEARRR